MSDGHIEGPECSFQAIASSRSCPVGHRVTDTGTGTCILARSCSAYLGIRSVQALEIAVGLASREPFEWHEMVLQQLHAVVLRGLESPTAARRWAQAEDSEGR
jgi:hypothetical protein